MYEKENEEYRNVLNYVSARITLSFFMLAVKIFNFNNGV